MLSASPLRTLPRALPRRCLQAAPLRGLSTAAAAPPTSSGLLEVRERQRGTLGVGAAPPFAPGGGDEAPIDVTAMEVFAAAHRIRQGEDGIKRTSMYHSRRLSKELGMEIYLKHEFTHPTGSFKERGGCVGGRGHVPPCGGPTLPLLYANTLKHHHTSLPPPPPPRAA